MQPSIAKGGGAARSAMPAGRPVCLACTVANNFQPLTPDGKRPRLCASHDPGRRRRPKVERPRAEAESTPSEVAARLRAAKHSTLFQLQVVRYALRLPVTARVKPTCRAFPGIVPNQVRRWIGKYARLSLDDLDAMVAQFKKAKKRWTFKFPRIVRLIAKFLTGNEFRKPVGRNPKDKVWNRFFGEWASAGPPQGAPETTSRV